MNRDQFLQAVRARRALGLVSNRHRLPRQQQPDTIRLEYFKAIRALLARAHEMVARELVPLLPSLLSRADDARMDSGKKVNEVMDRLSKEYFEALRPAQLENLAEKFGSRTSRFQREQLGKQIKAALGADVFLAEPGLAYRMGNFVAENVALIKSVPNKYLDDVEKTVTRAISAGDRASDLADALQDRFDVAENHAKLIARDQIGKFFGQLNQMRQEDLGVTGYIWRTANDNRVRAEHEEREGVHFEWDDPPEDGAPGEPIQCRCYAEPDLTGLLADL